MKRRDVLSLIPILSILYVSVGCHRCAHAAWPGASNTEDEPSGGWPKSRSKGSTPSRNGSSAQGCSIVASSNEGQLTIPPIVPSSKVPPLLVSKAKRFNEMLESIYQLTPGVGFIDDSRSPNAFATSENILPNGRDGSILLGLNLITLEMQKGAGSWEGAVALIHAHEFGHIAQFNHEYHASVPIMELQADALAGCAMANAILTEQVNISKLSYWQTQQITAHRRGELMHASKSLFDMGSYDFNNPHFHGTPHQRLSAFSAGFQLITRSSKPVPIRSAMILTRKIAEEIFA